MIGLLRFWRSTASWCSSGQAAGEPLKAADFFVDLLTTDLKPGAGVRETRAEAVRPLGQAYQKVPHPASGFAVVGIAVHLALNDDGSCKAAQIRVWLGSRCESVSRASIKAAGGGGLDEQTIASNAPPHTNNPNSASSEYSCHLAQVHMRRAIRAAKAAAQ